MTFPSSMLQPTQTTRSGRHEATEVSSRLSEGVSQSCESLQVDKEGASRHTTSSPVRCLCYLIV